MNKRNAEEQETHINIDYYDRLAHISTTKQHIYEKVVKRCQGIPNVKLTPSQWTVTVPLEYIRQPHLIIKSKAKGKGFQSKPQMPHVEQQYSQPETEKDNLPAESPLLS